MPDPPLYVDFARKEPAPPRSWKKARFTRSSTRVKGASAPPSSVEAITGAFASSSISSGLNGAGNSKAMVEEKKAPVSHSRETSGNDNQVRPVSTSSITSQPSTPQGQPQRPLSSTQPLSLAPSAGQPSSPKKPTLSGLAALENAISPSRSSSSTHLRQGSSEPASTSPGGSTRPSLDIANSPSRFIPASNSARSITPTPNSASNTNVSGGAKVSDFPKRSVGPGGSASSPTVATFNSTEPRQRDQTSPSKQVPARNYEPEPVVAQEEEDDDPLMKAYNALRSTPSQPALRTTGASSSSNLNATSARNAGRRPESTDLSARTAAAEQQNLGLGRATGGVSGGYSTHSRPSSPAPAPDHRRAVSPAPNAVRRAVSPAPVDDYADRRGAPANVNRYSSNGGNLGNPPVVDPYARASSPQPYAGNAATGRGVSPQPQGGYHAARAPSPAPLQHQQSQQSLSTQQRPGYSTASSAVSYGQPPPNRAISPRPVYAPPPPQQQHQQQQPGYASIPPSQSFEQHQQLLQQQAGARRPLSTSSSSGYVMQQAVPGPGQGYRSPSPQPQPQSQLPPQAYYAPPPQQGRQASYASQSSNYSQPPPPAQAHPVYATQQQQQQQQGAYRQGSPYQQPPSNYNYNSISSQNSAASQPQQYAQPAANFAPQQQQQQQHSNNASISSATSQAYYDRAASGGNVGLTQPRGKPATGAFDKTGRPILFYGVSISFLF